MRAVIITGSGTRAFCAGADIRHLSAASPLAVREFASLAVEVNRRIETLGKPVIAAINGAALGGGLELAESCLLRIAVCGARLGHPEVKIGAVAGFGGTTRLPRLVGRGRAAEMLLRGRAVDAGEALHIGLVHSVTDADRLLEESAQLGADYFGLVAVGALDKPKRFGGCIIAHSVGLGKTFEALAIIKYHELRNDRVHVLCPKHLRDQPDQRSTAARTTATYRATLSVQNSMIHAMFLHERRTNHACGQCAPAEIQSLSCPA